MVIPFIAWLRRRGRPDRPLFSPLLEKAVAYDSSRFLLQLAQYTQLLTTKSNPVLPNRRNA